MPEIDAGRLTLRPIDPAQARAIAGGAAPEGVTLTAGYPTRFSLEVMDLLAGERAD